MITNRYHILLKALWILLKLTLRIVIKVLVWGVVIDIARRVLLSIDAVVYYIGDFTQEQRELISHRNILGLILIIYTCKLLIQIVIWIKYTAISLINKSDKPIRERFNSKYNKPVKLILRRFIAYLLDVVVLWLIIWFISFIIGLTLSMIFGTKHIKSYALLAYFLAHLMRGAYFIYFEQSKNQASVGKRLLRLKVVDDKGGKLSTKASIIRYLYFYCLELPSTLRSIFGFYATANVLEAIVSPPYADTNTSIARLLQLYPKASISFVLFYWAWKAVWLIPIFFGKKKATLYDILSRTRVISTSK